MAPKVVRFKLRDGVPKDDSRKSARFSLGKPKLLADLVALGDSLGDRRIFTRDLLVNMRALLKKAQDSLTDLNSSEKIFLKSSVSEDKIVIWNPATLPQDERVNHMAYLAWQSYWHMVFVDKSLPEFEWIPEPVPVMIDVMPTPDSDDTDLVKGSVYRAAWEACPARQALQNLVLGYASNAPRIKKIVCFGLGTSSSSRIPSGVHFAQHCAAVDIAEALHSVYSSAVGHTCEPIKIYAQDPMYSPAHKQFLKSRFRCPVIVLDDPNGFLEIDENTLVMSAYCTVHVLEIVADLVWPKVPAAVFANDHSDYSPTRTRWATYDRMTPRVVEMLEQYDGWSFVEFGRRSDAGEVEDWVNKMALWFRNE